MSARGSLGLLLLLLLVLPTVLAVADTGQRALEGGWFTTPALREGSIFVYDETRIDLATGRAETLERAFTLHVGQTERISLLDRTQRNLLPVSYVERVSDWDLEDLGFGYGPATSASGTITNTMYLDADTGRTLRHEMRWDTVVEAEDADGQLRRERDRSVHVVKSWEQPLEGHWRPNQRYAFLHVGVAELVERVGIDIRPIDGRASHDGRTVYDVSMSDTGLGPTNADDCVMPFGPDMHLPDDRYDADGLVPVQRGRPQHSDWIHVDPAVAVPVSAGCRTTRDGPHGVAGFERRLDLVQQRRDPTITTGLSVWIGDREPSPMWVPLERTPTERPGVPANDDRYVPFGLDDALDLVDAAATDDLRAFLDKSRGGPRILDAAFEVWNASDEPMPRTLLPDSDAGSEGLDEWLGATVAHAGRQRATLVQGWTLDLYNEDGGSAFVFVRRYFDDGRVLLDETVIASQADPEGSKRPVVVDRAPQMVSLDTAMFHWWDHMQWAHDPEDWAFTPGARLTFRGPSQSQTTGFRFPAEITVGAPDDPGSWSSDTSSAEVGGRATVVEFDAESGRVDRHIRTDWQVTQIDGSGRPGTQAATVDAPTDRPYAYVPLLASVTGLATLVTFLYVAVPDLLRRLFVDLFVSPLYAKVRKDDVLHHETRDAMMQMLRSDPGLHTDAIRRSLKLGWGTTVHHLRTLERNGFVKSVREGNQRAWFVAEGAPVALKGHAVLRRPAAQRLARAVRAHPGASQQELAAALQVSDRTVRAQVTRLLDAGLVRCERDGRKVRYFPL